MQTDETISSPNQQTSDPQPANNLPPVQTPQPQQPTADRKTPKWLIVGLVALLLGTTGVFAYKYFQLKQQVIKKQPTPAPTYIPTPSFTPTSSPTMTVTPEPTSISSINWQTQQFTINNETAYAGKTSFTLTIKHPDDWKLREIPREADANNLIKNCADYVVSSQSINVKLEISPICGSWAAEYLPIPKDAEIVSKRENIGSDGHTSYLIRFFESTTSQYVYDQVAVSRDKSLDINSDKRNVGIMKVFGDTPFVFKATFSNPNNNELATDVADKIITYILSQ